MEITKLVNYLMIIMGLWIISIPWTLGFGFGANDVNYVFWNFLMIGLTIMMTSIISLNHLRQWAGWLSLFMGTWMIFSPFLLIYYKYNMLTIHSIIFGLLISICSFISIKQINERIKIKNID